MVLTEMLITQTIIAVIIITSQLPVPKRHIRHRKQVRDKEGYE